MESIPSDSNIHDMRQQDAFRSFTFSNFNKKQVRQAMYTSMCQGRVEPSCFWCAELVCSGHFLEIWETLLLFMSKEIHVANPQMIVYLFKRFQLFQHISSKSEFANTLALRNHKAIREVFAELICNFCHSSKRPCFEVLQVKCSEDFEITESFQATDLSFHGHVLKKGDPDELVIGLNELGFHLKARNMHRACYWLEWILELESMCTKRKEPLQCVQRDYNVDSKYRCDLIWILWDLFFVYAKADVWIQSNMEALCFLFAIKYTTAVSRRRKYLLYLAIGIMCETLTKERSQEIIGNRLVLETVIAQIHQIYKQIKEKEQGHSTDYLYMSLGEKEAEFQSMVQKLEYMQSMDIVANSGMSIHK